MHQFNIFWNFLAIQINSNHFYFPHWNHQILEGFFNSISTPIHTYFHPDQTCSVHSDISLIIWFLTASPHFSVKVWKLNFLVHEPSRYISFLWLQQLLMLTLLTFWLYCLGSKKTHCFFTYNFVFVNQPPIIFSIALILLSASALRLLFFNVTE